jgi:NAD(P)-dependent dehydrogenase (short-subunit alcohol dehydrogenase family)
MKYKYKSVLITDASHPVAQAIIARLEREGLTVIKNYPRDTGKEIVGLSRDSYAYNTWILKEMNELLENIIKNIGNINYLVHTDNVVFRGLIEQTSEEDFKKALDYNTKSAFITTKVFGEHIAQNGGGAIVYLSTLHDEKPTGCAFAYSVSKGAVRMLCKEIALFYGRRGVRANVVQMDPIKGEERLFDSLISPFNYDASTKIPLRRLARPEDFAGVVSFLLSDDAVFINGADIRVDGGHLLYYFDR